MGPLVGLMSLFGGRKKEKNSDPVTFTVPSSNKYASIPTKWVDGNWSPQTFGEVAQEEMRRSWAQKVESEAPYGDEYYSLDEHGTKLTEGLLRGAKIPNRLIKDAKSAADKYGVDPMDILAVAAAESTFGYGPFGSGRVHENHIDGRSLFTYNDFTVKPPKTFEEFAFDKGENVIASKNAHGYFFDPGGDNPEELYENHNLRKEYVKYLSKFKDEPAQKSIVDLVAKRIKEKGIASYNPGDSGYSERVLQYKQMLKNNKYPIGFQKGGAVNLWDRFKTGVQSIGPMGVFNTLANYGTINPLNSGMDILAPMSIPGNMVQAAYTPGVSVGDAMKGQDVEKGFIEEILTDPTTYLGGSLMSLGKVRIKEIVKSIFEKNNSKLLNKDFDEIYNAVKSRINTPEGKWRLQRYNDVIRSSDAPVSYADRDYISHIDPQAAAIEKYITYQNQLNGINNLSKEIKGYNRGPHYNLLINKVMLPKNLDPEMSRQVIRHEIEHGIQQGNSGYFNDLLNNLTLKEVPDNYIPPKLPSSMSKLKERTDDVGLAVQYFTVSPQERGAFLSELQQRLLDEKYINNAYDDITPELIRNAYNKMDKKGLRMFNIIEPSYSNFDLIAKGLNRLAGIAGPVYVGSQIQTKKKGGAINTTGYTPGYPSMNNPYNIIPGGNITMKNTPFPLQAFPIYGTGVGSPTQMFPGADYQFPGADGVLEVPNRQYGGDIPGGGMSGIYYSSPTRYLTGPAFVGDPFMAKGGGFFGNLWGGIKKGIGGIGKAIGKGFGAAGDQLLSFAGMPNVIQNSVYDQKAPGWMQGLNSTVGGLATGVAGAALPGAGMALQGLQGLAGLFGGSGGNQGGVGGYGFPGMNFGGVNFNDGDYGSSSLLAGLNPFANMGGGNMGSFGTALGRLNIPLNGPGLFGGIAGGTPPFQPRYYQEGGPVMPQPIQTEKGEMFIHSDMAITPTHARELHKNMDEDEVTDYIPGGYVASADKKIKMTRKEADEIVMGIKTFPYKEGKKGKLPEEIYFSELFGDHRKMTPAELTEAVYKKFPTVDKRTSKLTYSKNDVFTELTNQENIKNRQPWLETIIAFNESQRKTEPVRMFQKGGDVLGTILGTAGTALPFLYDLFGGNKGQTNVDPIARNLVFGSLPLSTYGLSQNLAAQRSALSTGINDFTGLGQNLNQYALGTLGASTAGILGQDTTYQRFNPAAQNAALSNFNTRTPSNVIDSLAPTYNLNSLAQTLGPRGFSVVAPQLTSQYLDKRNQFAANQFNQDRSLAYDILGRKNQLDTFTQQFNIGQGEKEQQARNQQIAGVAGNFGSYFNRLGDIQSQILPITTGLNIQRAGLQGQLAMGTAQNMMNAGGVYQAMQNGAGVPQNGGSGSGDNFQWLKQMFSNNSTTMQNQVDRIGRARENSNRYEFVNNPYQYPMQLGTMPQFAPRNPGFGPVPQYDMFGRLITQ